MERRKEGEREGGRKERGRGRRMEEMNERAPRELWGDDENVLHVNCDVATWVLRHFSKLIELDT